MIVKTQKRISKQKNIGVLSTFRSQSKTEHAQPPPPSRQGIFGCDTIERTVNMRDYLSTISSESVCEETNGVIRPHPALPSQDQNKRSKKTSIKTLIGPVHPKNRSPIPRERH